MARGVERGPISREVFLKTVDLDIFAAPRMILDAELVDRNALGSINPWRGIGP
jgi:hypothetical protein